jgi:hypothetical protein
MCVTGVHLRGSKFRNAAFENSVPLLFSVGQIVTVTLSEAAGMKSTAKRHYRVLLSCPPIYRTIAKQITRVFVEIGHAVRASSRTVS